MPKSCQESESVTDTTSHDAFTGRWHLNLSSETIVPQTCLYSSKANRNEK